MTDQPRALTTLDFPAMKKAGRKIVSLTAYDALAARILDESGVDIILVGDSVNQVVAGRPTTLSATLDQMIYHARAVQGAVHRALVVVDLPFLSYQVTPEDAIRNAGRVLQETDAAAVKLEGGVTMAPDHPGAGGARHSRHGAHRPHAAVGARPGRLPGAGAGDRRGRPPDGRCPCGGRRRRLQHRARTGALGAGREGVGRAHHSDGRHRRRAPVATARCWCFPTCSA